MLNSSEKAILLLDEPTSHLDGESQAQVLENLFALARENSQTVLMVAHRLDTAVTYCDKVMVLEQGTVADFDKPLNLLVEDPTDTEVTKEDSIFSDMVKALQQSQQAKILENSRK